MNKALRIACRTLSDSPRLIVYYSQGMSGWEDRSAARKNCVRFFRSRIWFYATILPSKRNGSNIAPPRHNRFPARELVVRTLGCVALNARGHGKHRKKVHLLGRLLRCIGGGFVFRSRRCLDAVQAARKVYKSVKRIVM